MSPSRPWLKKAWSLGCRLDGWSDVFDMKKWETAMDLTGINAADFALRTYEKTDQLPWEHIDIGVTKEFLWRENRRALEACITPDCKNICQNCGLRCHTDTVKGETGKRRSLKTIIILICLRVSDSPIRRFMVIGSLSLSESGSNFQRQGD